MKCRYCQEEVFRMVDVGIGDEKIPICHTHAVTYSSQHWFMHLPPKERWRQAEILVHIVKLISEVKSRKQDQFDSAIAISGSPTELINRLKDKKEGT